MPPPTADAAGIGPLLRGALTRRALEEAFDRVRANRGMAGTDGQSIDDFGVQLALQLHTLATEVVGRRYAPQPLLRIWLPRPGKPPRPLGVPAVRDRVLQTAVAESLRPHVEAELEACSYAYRRGRGVRHAVERIQALQRQGYRWVVDADIAAFFDTIPHDAMLARVQALATEPALVALVHGWLAAPVREGATLSPVACGLAQGGPISPMLANLYLDSLDEALLDANHMLVRYADDFLVLARTRERAEHALELTSRTLERLHLKLNPLKTRIVSFDTGLEFLGWNFVRTLALPASRAADLAEPQALPSNRPSADAAAAPGPTAMAQAFEEAAREAPERDSGPPLPADAVDAAADAAQAEPQEPSWQDGGGAAPVGDHAATDEEDDANTDTEPAAPALPALAPLQRTLYVVDPQARLVCAAGRLAVEREGRTLLDLPSIQVDMVLLFGPVQVSTQALHLLLRAGAGIAFLTRLGRCLGRLEPLAQGSLELAQAQHRATADAGFALSIARALVQAKILRSATVLTSYRRRHPRSTSGPADAAAAMRELARRAASAATLDTLRGFEGAAAAAYWQTWASMLPSTWGFAGRVARPAPDPVNAMLSFGYTLLHHTTAGLLQARGLDARLGCLHAARGTHLALASDLMEPWRAPLVDAVVLNLALNMKLGPADFRTAGGRCHFAADASRVLVRAYEDRLNAERQTDAADGEVLDMRRWMDRDILAYVRALRGGDASSFECPAWR